MGIFKELETFFGKTIPKVITKEIPKFVTKTIPSVFERDTYAPDLPPLRKEVDRLSKNVSTARDAFYAGQSKLRKSHNRYERLAEDFRKSAADNAVALRVDTKGAEKLSQEMGATEKTLKDVYLVTRTGVGILTIGLAEIGFMQADNAEERKQLESRKSALTALLGRYNRATRQVASTQKTVDAALAEVEAALRASGIAVGAGAASQLTESQVIGDVKRELAAKLLADGVSPEGIALVTGLTDAEIAQVSPDESDPLPKSPDPTVFTDDEIALFGASKGMPHVV